MGKDGFDGARFKALVDAASGDVAAAAQKWLVDNNRIEPGTPIIGLEIPRLEALARVAVW
ncbi:hypothetical protein [Streptomyces erythrochromogenes]|uniref:hypothetical protein n=1 Tax=Streptomyces erythrochromogenes TaxID=285574 RepID=UPI0036B0EA8F